MGYSITSSLNKRYILHQRATQLYLWGLPIVGMICDIWEQSPGDYGIFGPNDGRGDLVAVVRPSTPADRVPDRNDDLRILEICSDQCYWLFRLVGTLEEVKAFMGNPDSVSTAL
jgi:hypothetical protein